MPSWQNIQKICLHKSVIGASSLSWVLLLPNWPTNRACDCFLRVAIFPFSRLPKLLYLDWQYIPTFSSNDRQFSKDPQSPRPWTLNRRYGVFVFVDVHKSFLPKWLPHILLQSSRVIALTNNIYHHLVVGVHEDHWNEVVNREGLGFQVLYLQDHS